MEKKLIKTVVLIIIEKNVKNEIYEFFIAFDGDADRFLVAEKKIMD